MQKLIKKLAVVGTLCSMLCVSTVPVVANAQTMDKAVTSTKKETKTMATWTKTSDGWEYFNGKTYPTGWIKDTKGNWYFLYKNGTKNLMASGEFAQGYWVNKSGKWIESAGRYKWEGSDEKGWKFVLTSNPSVYVTGWNKINHKWYYFNQSGYAQDGMVIANDGSIWWSDNEDDFEMNEVELQYSEKYDIVDNHLTKPNGTVRFNGHLETWYSTYESGGQSTARSIPGKHIADDGTIRDADGFVCVATNQKFYQYGDIIMTTVGPAKVYDCGCLYGKVDVYTNWH